MLKPVQCERNSSMRRRFDIASTLGLRCAGGLCWEGASLGAWSDMETAALPKHNVGWMRLHCYFTAAWVHVPLFLHCFGTAFCCLCAHRGGKPTSANIEPHLDVLCKWELSSAPT